MSLIQIGEIVDCLNIQLVTLVTTAAGAYDARGRWVQGAETTTPDVRVDVQPASGRTLEILPEGERTKEHVTAFFPQLVDTTDQIGGLSAARMYYRGVVWKAVAVPEDWRENGFTEVLFQNTKQVAP